MMNSSSTGGHPTAEKIAPYVLLGMTAVTGLVDAVSFLSLGSVFTANMTGNILILAFATARVSGLSVARSSTALIAFFVGAILGGRITASANPDFMLSGRRNQEGCYISIYAKTSKRNRGNLRLEIPEPVDFGARLKKWWLPDVYRWIEERTNIRAKKVINRICAKFPRMCLNRLKTRQTGGEPRGEPGKSKGGQ